MTVKMIACTTAETNMLRSLKTKGGAEDMALLLHFMVVKAIKLVVGDWGRKDGNNGLHIRNWMTKYVGVCVNQYTFRLGEFRRQS